MNFFTLNKTDINLTGNQIANILDSITNQILYSLNMFTSVLDVNLVSVLSWVSNNRRKKISSISRELQLQYLYTYLVLDDVDERFRVLKRLKLDRFYTRKLAKSVLDTAEDYIDLYKKFQFKKATEKEILRMSELEVRCKSSRLHLYPLLLNLKSYIDLYETMTDMILSKYYKLLWSLVKRRVYSTSRHFDEDELYQNYILATLKALDRYDPTKGALTSYIKLWIKNIQQSAEENPEYGIAYELPQLQIKKQVKDDEGVAQGAVEDNFSVSLNALLEERELPESTLGTIEYSPDKIEEVDRSKVLLYLAKCADPIGIARLSLGIDEYVDNETLLKMKSFMLKQRNSKTVNT